LFLQDFGESTCKGFFYGGSMKVGDTVIVREGASAWMKDRGYWLECMGDNIDGKIGKIVNDYTDLPGDASHYGIELGFDYIIGINENFLKNLKN
jgi:hypothetical protein